MKGGNILDFWKGGIDLEKWGMAPLTNYDSSSIHRYFFGFQIKYFSIYRHFYDLQISADSSSIRKYLFDLQIEYFFNL